MDLEELQVMWDAEHKESRFTLDEAGLHAIVQRRIRESSRCAACRYRTEISISVGFAGLTLIVASLLAFGSREWIDTLPWPKIVPSRWDITGLFIAGGVWLYFAWYLNRARLRLQRSGESFECSLRGDIDRALAWLEVQIKIARDIVWWGFVPLYAAIMLWVHVVFRLSTAPGRAETLNAIYVMSAAVMIAAFVMEVCCRRAAIRERYEPHRRELESLRRKLADSPTK